MTLGDTNVGVLLFKNIFTIAPGALQLFSFRDTKNLYENPKFKTHVKKVVNTVGVAVEMLENLDELVPILQQQGKNHVPREVKPEHYPIVGQALLDTLEAGLGD
jgi:nitric oxide dioxygenase